MRSPIRYFNGSPEVIRLAVMTYIRYPLSLRQVEIGFEIELTGDIARMVGLSLAEGKTKQAVLDEKTACSVKMVAGARNQRYLQISEGWVPRVS